MVTLREVAERAGVSIKTVSRIVNDDPAVNAKTRKAVEAHIDALNYVPNHAARVMRGAQSSVYGLMTDVVATTPYSVDIVRGAQSALKHTHQTLLIASSDGDAEREGELWRMFRAHRVAGVVYAAMFHRPHNIGEPGFHESIVLANCYDAKNNRTGIVPDDEQGGYEQARYLLQRGHRNIAHITLIDHIAATYLRKAGIRRAFQEAGVSFDPTLERQGFGGVWPDEISKVREEAFSLLQLANRPTAIICGNDSVAMQVYSVASQLGISVPQDLSLIGFDDLKLISELLHPKLTTVALPYFDIGRLAVEMMNTNGATAHQKILVPCPLVERDSCRTLN
jgi:LacI family transcriptional regulator